jgi:hypothetical protein
MRPKHEEGRLTLVRRQIVAPARPAEIPPLAPIDLEGAMRQVDESLSDVIRLLYQVLRQHEEIREALSRQGVMVPEASPPSTL